MKNDIEINKIVYEGALKFLYEIKPKELSDEELEKYFTPNRKFNSKNDILECLVESLQNYQSMPNVIGFKERYNKFKKILFNFDENKILNKYKNYEMLLEAFSSEFKIDKITYERKNNSWVKYSKGILSGCKFLQQFDNEKEFDYFVKLFSYNETTSAALPMLLSKEIYGFGFALSCNFLKEVGYEQYPKPDIHLMDIFSKLGLSTKNEYDCYKAIIHMAKINNVTPYKVDKVFWLISSGKYYLDDIIIDRYKKRFIELIKEKLIM